MPPTAAPLGNCNATTEYKTHLIGSADCLCVIVELPCLNSSLHNEEIMSIQRLVSAAVKQTRLPGYTARLSSAVELQ